MHDANKDDPDLDLPDLGYFQHLADYLFEAGPTSGEQALTWTELSKWQELSGIDIGGWRAGAIVNLSRTFLSALHKARDENYPRPLENEADETTREARGAAAANKLQRGNFVFADE